MFLMILTFILSSIFEGGGGGVGWSEGPHLYVTFSWFLQPSRTKAFTRKKMINGYTKSLEIKVCCSGCTTSHVKLDKICNNIIFKEKLPPLCLHNRVAHGCVGRWE
jgi:hypothetical protein